MNIYAQNAPEYVWWPGSAWTHWRSLCARRDLLATMRGLLLRRGRGGEEGREEGLHIRGRKGRGEGLLLSGAEGGGREETGDRKGGEFLYKVNVSRITTACRFISVQGGP